MRSFRNSVLRLVACLISDRGRRSEQRADGLARLSTLRGTGWWLGSGRYNCHGQARPATVGGHPSQHAVGHPAHRGASRPGQRPTAAKPPMPACRPRGRRPWDMRLRTGTSSTGVGTSPRSSNRNCSSRSYGRVLAVWS